MRFTHSTADHSMAVPYMTADTICHSPSNSVTGEAPAFAEATAALAAAASRRGIVERYRSLIDGTHAETTESISCDFHSRICQHAAGNRLSFHLQFRHGPCALNQVQIVSH